MIHPDDTQYSFKARWEALCRVLLVETSVKFTAVTASWYADFDDGTKCRPSNDRICRNTGYSRRTVVSAWAVLRQLGMAERVEHSAPHKRKADVYELAIPYDWTTQPILGPHERAFTCQHCGKGFNPPPIAFLNEQGKLRYHVNLACFCPSSHDSVTGRCKRPEACCRCAWNHEQTKAGNPLPWGKTDAWKHFRAARGEDWPALEGAA